VATQLPGMKVAGPLEADKATHLVLAEPKRTMKLLRAVARGAWVLTPDWVTASAEAGRWVDEAPYETEHFPGAKRAREAMHPGGTAAGTGAAGAAADSLTGGGGISGRGRCAGAGGGALQGGCTSIVSRKSLLLNGMRICVQERSAPPSAAELKALVTAAGGELAPRAKGAAVVISSGGSGVGAGGPGGKGRRGGSAMAGKDAEVVKETWLMQAIADYAVPPFYDYRPF